MEQLRAAAKHVKTLEDYISHLETIMCAMLCQRVPARADVTDAEYQVCLDYALHLRPADDDNGYYLAVDYYPERRTAQTPAQKGK